jgi:vacuolar-type H+-ATPase subunit H
MSAKELIEEEKKAMMMAEQAKSTAEKMILEANEKAKEIVSRVTKREFLETRLREEEERSQAEAETIMKTYLAEAAKIKQVQEDRLQRAVNLVLMEVLKVG